MSSETHKKIKSAVADAIPRRLGFTIYTSETGFDGMEVVRVITPAWKLLGKAERIAKVQEAVLGKLDSSERGRIFRFSVLTPQEWLERKPMLVGEKSRKLGFRRARAAAKE